jgi:hypothetical protein
MKYALIGGIAAILVAGTATAAAMSYVTAAGDETRWGVRAFKRLGIEKAIHRHLVRKAAREGNAD